MTFPSGTIYIDTRLTKTDRLAIRMAKRGGAILKREIDKMAKEWEAKHGSV